MLKNEQKSAKTLPQKLAGLNKGRGAWGENLACGVAWQSVLLERSGAWQGVVNLATHNTAWRSEFDNEMAQHSKFQRHDNKIQHNEFIKASTAQQIQQNTANLAMQTAQSVILRVKQSRTQQAQQIQLGRCLRAKQAKRKWGSVWAGDFSLSLSLS